MMDLESNLHEYLTPLMAIFLFVITTFITIVRKLKLRWPINVNCWFCNCDTKIYLNQLDWWRCKNCHQYNGFTKDGDYAYEIPEQRLDSSKIYSNTVKSKKYNDPISICDDCNRKEELKLAELQKFETNWFFDSKLQKFKTDLESKYPLCENCRNLVIDVLSKQSEWLTRYKMLFFRKKSIDDIVQNAKKLDKVVRNFLTILTSVLMCYPNYWRLPFIGAFFQTTIFAINQTNKRTRDAFLTVMWIVMSLVGPLNEMEVLKNLIIRWPLLESITEHHLITILALIIGITNITSNQRKTKISKASFKRLESSFGKNAEAKNCLKDFLSNDDRSIIYTNYCTNSEVSDPLAVDDTPWNQRNRKPEIDKNSSSISCVTISSSVCAVGNDSPDGNSGRKHILKFDDNQYSLNDNLPTLRKLSLGETLTRSPKVSEMFRTRVYDTTSPDLFRSSRSSTRKFVLTPPKLKSATQTSWVAGGYWQFGLDTPTLSRSSSQSSGFGSGCSNFGRSREPSINKDVEKSLILSDTQYLGGLRSNSVNSINSCCQHNSGRSNQRCGNSNFYNKPVTIAPSNSIYAKNSQSHFSPIQTDYRENHFNSYQNGHLNSSKANEQQRNCNQSGYHCQTFFNNPFWLPILLSASLVFNVAVFCTILMR